LKDNISNITETIRIIKQNNLTLKKSLGQNFLVDSNILDKIINCSDIDRDTGVIEIGPGIGALTQKLAQKAGKVVAIEIDQSLIPILKDTLSDYKNIKIINNDVLKVSLADIISEEMKGLSKVQIVANLPYYITSPIIIKLLTDELNIDSITILVQKEVAERISAKPGGKAYGSLTILINYFAEVKLAFYVSKNVFIPKPKVDSAVLYLQIHKEPIIEIDNEDLFFKLIRTSFMHRRKTLYNNLAFNFFDKDEKKELNEILIECKIDGIRRAETLSIEEFANLANLINTKMLEI